MADGLTWKVTGLWHPSHSMLSDLPYYGHISIPIDGEVVIPLNDSRTASVTISEYDDDIVTAVLHHCYARCLKAYYRDQLVFWGPIKTIEYGLDDMAPGTVKLNAVDPSIRLISHFLVRGDTALDGPHGDTGSVSVDHVGLRLLRDAGLNTAGQTARGVPDLGIVNGTNDFSADPTSLIGVERGQQVWQAMISLSQTLGPDFELEPVEDTVGAYAKLNTYDGQGSDVSAAVAFHYGTGKQNLDGLSFIDGSVYITHAHVLDQDSKYRFTEANLDASADTGPYVFWDTTDYSAKGIDATDVETVLRQYGRDILNGYSRPLLTCTLTLPIETDSSYVYGVDYSVGDIVGVAGRAGAIDMEQAPYRITEVRLRQANADNALQPEIDTVPDRVAAASDSYTDAED